MKISYDGKEYVILEDQFDTVMYLTCYENGAYCANCLDQRNCECVEMDGDELRHMGD